MSDVFLVMTDPGLQETSVEDAAIVAAVRKGDTEQYAELVKRHQQRVYAIAWSRLGDATLAEEATQEAFIRGYRRLWLLVDGRKFASWLASIVRNTAINLGVRERRELLRRERWAIEHQDDVPTADEPALSSETLQSAIGLLPPNYRECLVLFYVEGKSGQEAAEALGITDAAFRVRLHRAKALLRQELETTITNSLAQLRPSAALVPGVMAALASSWTAKAATFGVGSGVAGALAKFAPMAWLLSLFSWVGMAPAIFLAWLQYRSDARNFRDPDGFRARLFRADARGRILWFGLFFLLMTWAIPAISSQIGFRTFYLILGGWSIWRAMMIGRRLRIARNPFQVVVFVSTVILGLGVVAVGLHLLPLWLVVGLVGAAMVLSVAGRPYLPMRMDYNLFLRAAAGLLPDSRSEDRRITAQTRQQLISFARFLGDRWLVDDYRWSGPELLLRLPPVRSGSFGFWTDLRKWSGSSQISLSATGPVKAILALTDKEELAKVVPDLSDGALLQAQVESALVAAWRKFETGHMVEAERALGQAPEEAIFKVSPARGRANRWRLRLTVLLGVVTILLCVVRGLRPHWFSNLHEVRLSEAEVRQALAQLSQPEGARLSNGATYALLFSAVLPPRELFTPAALKVVQKEVLVARLSGAAAYLDLRASRELAAGWLNFEELGTTPAEFKNRLRLEAPHDWASILPRFAISGTAANGIIEKCDFGALARLQLLRDAQCLDLLDRETLVRKIASLQVRSGQGAALRDWRAVHGLFCTLTGPLLQETYSQLAALEILDGLGAIDREACIRGLLSLHRGSGFFVPPDTQEDWKFQVRGDARDTYCAFQSLRILGALDRVRDLPQWKLRTVHQSRGLPGQRQVTWDEIEAWVARGRIARFLTNR